jgi:hypothetical protein
LTDVTQIKRYSQSTTILRPRESVTRLHDTEATRGSTERAIWHTYCSPPVRTFDALHLASLEYLRSRGQNVALASYDERMIVAAKAMGIGLAGM